MSITAVCSSCGKKYKVADGMAGKRVVCKGCGSPFTVPQAIANAHPAASPPPLPSVEGAPSPSTAARGKRSRVVVLSLSIGIPLIVLAGLAATQDRWLPLIRRQPASVLPPSVQAFQHLYPVRPPPLKAFPDIDRYDVRLPARDGDPEMAVCVYLPAGRHDAKSLPCVFIAPAASWMHGMGIDDGDRPEHYPYVRAGFAVVCYELSGSVADPKKKKQTYADLIRPTQIFMQSQGGIRNAQRAIDYVIDRVPEANPAQFYACGHSSAAVVALDVAAAEPRIRACCAYAPTTDVEAWWKPVGLEKYIPRFMDFARDHSPLRHVGDIRCPVLLFHADDDTAVPLEDSLAYVDAAKKAGKAVKFVRVPTGEHYDSMIEQGIPCGIEFMKANGAAPLPPSANPGSDTRPAGLGSS